MNSSLPPDTTILSPRISFRVKITDIDNQHELYSITCRDVSSMLEGVEFAVSFAPVAIILYLLIIIVIASVEGLIIIVLDISNAFQNTIPPNPEERVYLSLPYLYLEWFKRKWPKYPFASRNQKELCIKEIKSIQGTRPAGIFWCDFLNSILITVKIPEAPMNMLYSHSFT